MSLNVVIYMILLLGGVGAYVIWRRQRASASCIQLNNQRMPVSEVKKFPEDKIAALIIPLFQSKGYRIQKTSGELQKFADFQIEKDDARGFVSTRHWGATTVGVSEISQEVIGMNQQNSSHNYIFTIGKFDKEASDMAKYNRNLFLVDSRQLNVLLAAAQ